MKILGLTYRGGKAEMYMKPDSALLVNEKPFFLPAFSGDIAFRPCLVVRVSRLGRNIEERFASRYYDAWTVGLNMFDMASDVESQLQTIGFDNALPLGKWLEVDKMQDTEVCLMCNEEEKYLLKQADLMATIDKAIAELTRYVTIRMGDFIAVDYQVQDACKVIHEDKWIARLGDETLLLCKMK